MTANPTFDFWFSSFCPLSFALSPLPSVVCHLTFSPSNLLPFCLPSSVICHLTFLPSHLLPFPLCPPSSVVCHLTFLPSHLLPFPLCPLPSVISPFCPPSSVFCPLSSVLRLRHLPFTLSLNQKRQKIGSIPYGYARIAMRSADK